MMRVILSLLGAVSVLLAPTMASAQSGYPDRPIKILVGFTPGVAPDITSRLIGDKFTEVWGKPVVVENITGAGGNIATDRAAKSPPDGYTLVMGGNASLVFNASLMKLPYDPVADFAPITQVFIAANILTVPPEIPAKTIEELAAYAKANPGKLTYGHAGVGTSQHLGGELFKFITKTDIQPVAYR